MKCLAVQQPWAWAICAGYKRIENRSWKTPYRGPVVIVASNKKKAGTDAYRRFPGLRLPVSTLVYGAIIGTAELTDVVPLSAAVEDDPHAFGPYCWVLVNPRMFEMPIPTSARLRLYDPTPEEARKVQTEAADPPMDLSNPVYAEFARSLEPDPLERRLEHGIHYLNQGQWADLERVTAHLLKLGPSEPETHFFRGEIAAQAGRHADAVTAYTRALQLDPRYAVAYFRRSFAHRGLGNVAAADADYAKAIKLEPGLADGGPGQDGGEDDE